MADITLQNVYKMYDKKVTAVTDFNLKIKDKEFIVFVGPSGCGKSTTLRMIAGLEEISSGTLTIGGKIVNDVAPKDRNIAMVFQNYALYPHMNVYNNMAFGLKLRKFPKSEIDRRVMEASKILGLETMLSRKPKAMSGGQRQRVALGRAIVRDPQVFLMDEPLSNLDAKLRVQMRAELIKLHNRLQTTTIYVTHDQTEAMTMASRIVIMKDGIIQQVGTPKEVYDNPVNMFVGSFIGSPAMNFLYGKLRGNAFYLSENTKVVLPECKFKFLQSQNYQNKEIVLGIRPEALYLDSTQNHKDIQKSITVEVEVVELMGAESVLYSRVEDQDLIARIDSDQDVTPGQNIQLSINMENIHFFDPESQACISIQNEGKMESVIV